MWCQVYNDNNAACRHSSVFIVFLSRWLDFFGGQIMLVRYLRVLRYLMVVIFLMVVRYIMVLRYLMAEDNINSIFMNTKDQVGQTSKVFQHGALGQ